jgi:hypothetical protein
MVYVHLRSLLSASSAFPKPFARITPQTVK